MQMRVKIHLETELKDESGRFSLYLLWMHVCGEVSGVLLCLSLAFKITDTNKNCCWRECHISCWRTL